MDEWTGLVRPTDVCIDREGTVYVTELGLRVSIFTGEGKLLTRFGNEDGKEKETALFLAPHTIRVDSKGDIYIGEVSKTYAGIDKGLQTLQKFARQAW